MFFLYTGSKSTTLFYKVKRVRLKKQQTKPLKTVKPKFFFYCFLRTTGKSTVLESNLLDRENKTKPKSKKN